MLVKEGEIKLQQLRTSLNIMLLYVNSVVSIV